MIRRPPRSTQSRSSAASDVYKRQDVYLAVDVSETAFQTFTLGRLQTCTQLFGLYVCPRNNVVDKRTSQECLMALFTGKMSQVRAVCQWTKSNRNMAVQLNGTAFMVYIAPPNVEQAVVKCPGQAERQRLSGSSIIDLTPGCEMYSCLLYTSPSPRDLSTSRMPSSA